MPVACFRQEEARLGLKKRGGGKEVVAAVAAAAAAAAAAVHGQGHSMTEDWLLAAWVGGRVWMAKEALGGWCGRPALPQTNVAPST